jgi:hypothetical protein
MSMLKVAL